MTDTQMQESPAQGRGSLSNDTTRAGQTPNNAGDEYIAPAAPEQNGTSCNSEGTVNVPKHDTAGAVEFLRKRCDENNIAPLLLCFGRTDTVTGAKGEFR